MYQHISISSSSGTLNVHLFLNSRMQHILRLLFNISCSNANICTVSGLFLGRDREKTNEQLNTQWTVVTGGQCMDGKHTAAHLTPK